MIDIKCPTCGRLYHTDVIHLGKHIKCSFCGSVILLLESPGTVVPSRRATPTVRAAGNALREFRLSRRVLIWAVSSGLGLTVLCALAWYAVVGEKTAADDERGSTNTANSADRANRAPDTPVGNATGTSNISDIVDPASKKKELVRRNQRSRKNIAITDFFNTHA
jgi:DNA-directed RNA polymerase subunit RPC12/RpoP